MNQISVSTSILDPNKHFLAPPGCPLMAANVILSILLTNFYNQAATVGLPSNYDFLSTFLFPEIPFEYLTMIIDLINCENNSLTSFSVSRTTVRLLMGYIEQSTQTLKLKSKCLLVSSHSGFRLTYHVKSWSRDVGRCVTYHSIISE